MIGPLDPLHELGPGTFVEQRAVIRAADGQANQIALQRQGQAEGRVRGEHEAVEPAAEPCLRNVERHQRTIRIVQHGRHQPCHLLAVLGRIGLAQIVVHAPGAFGKGLRRQSTHQPGEIGAVQLARLNQGTDLAGQQLDRIGCGIDLDAITMRLQPCPEMREPLVDITRAPNLHGHSFGHIVHRCPLRSSAHPARVRPRRSDKLICCAATGPCRSAHQTAATMPCGRHGARRAHAPWYAGHSRSSDDSGAASEVCGCWCSGHIKLRTAAIAGKHDRR